MVVKFNRKLVDTSRAPRLVYYSLCQSGFKTYRDRARTNSTTKVKFLSAIITCVHVLLVQVLGENGKTWKRNNYQFQYRRILHGQIADPADFRFTVLLQMGMRCGGTVISNHFVLTTAHCIINIECYEIKIFPSNWVEGTWPRVHPFQCYIHEKYVLPHIFNDIALIQTVENLLEDHDFEVIPLPPPGMYYPPGTYGLIAGWGMTERSSKLEHLLRGDTFVIDWDTCNSVFMNSATLCGNGLCYSPEIPKKVFCTQGRGTEPSGVCFGDSGGPVVIQGVVAGVVARTLGTENGSCLNGSPSLFINVADFLPWIYGIIEPGRDTS